MLYVNYIQDIEKFAIKLHNEFEPSWNLNKTIEFIWQLKLNCFNNEEIRKWFTKLDTNNNNEPPIIIENLPDELSRDDWR